MFLLVLGSLGASGYLYTLLRQEQAARAALEQQVNGFGPRFDQFKEAVRGVDRQLSATVFQEVDLGATGWQPITGGLYVIDLSAAPAGGLPVLDSSDSYVENALVELLGHKKIRAFLHLDGAIRRFVATVDNLATGDAPASLWPVQTTEGRFETEPRSCSTS